MGWGSLLCLLLSLVTLRLASAVEPSMLLALEAGQLDLRVIDVKGHVRVPGFGDGGERVMEVDLAGMAGAEEEEKGEEKEEEMQRGERQSAAIPAPRRMWNLARARNMMETPGNCTVILLYPVYPGNVSPPARRPTKSFSVDGCQVNACWLLGKK